MVRSAECRLKEAPEYRVRLSDLAQKVLLSRSNLTHLVDRLEKAGLLYPERCPSDRRGIYAVLTEAGLEMQQKMWTFRRFYPSYHYQQDLRTECQKPGFCVKISRRKRLFLVETGFFA
ncbi:MarR family transcriptional regulator [Microcoleus sp. herbarium14]